MRGEGPGRVLTRPCPTWRPTHRPRPSAGRHGCSTAWGHNHSRTEAGERRSWRHDKEQVGGEQDHNRHWDRWVLRLSSLPRPRTREAPWIPSRRRTPQPQPRWPSSRQTFGASSWLRWLQLLASELRYSTRFSEIVESRSKVQDEAKLRQNSSTFIRITVPWCVKGVASRPLPCSLRPP